MFSLYTCVCQEVRGKQASRLKKISNNKQNSCQLDTSPFWCDRVRLWRDTSSQRRSLKSAGSFSASSEVLSFLALGFDARPTLFLLVKLFHRLLDRLDIDYRPATMSLFSYFLLYSRLDFRSFFQHLFIFSGFSSLHLSLMVCLCFCSRQWVNTSEVEGEVFTHLFPTFLHPLPSLMTFFCLEEDSLIFLSSCESLFFILLFAETNTRTGTQKSFFLFCCLLLTIFYSFSYCKSFRSIVIIVLVLLLSSV